MLAAATAACTLLAISTDVPLSTVPPRYASWNIDSTRDRLFFDADLGSAQLARLMAAASGGNHSSLRFGGTGNDYLFYGGVGGSPACAATVPFSYECLNATLFDNLLSLAGAAGAPIIFGLNIHPATGAPSPPKGAWDASNARFLLAEAQRRGSPISHVELGNEQNTIMTAQQQAAALGVLSGVLDELYPAPSAGRPLLVGPDTHSIHDAGSPNSAVLRYLADFVSATAKLPLHAVTHHEYIEIDYLNVLNSTFLDESALLGGQVVAAVRAVSKGVQVWAGEIGPHNGGGGSTTAPTNCAGNRVCGRFGSAIWYADALAAKAAAGYAKFCRQDAIGADYALLNATRDAAGAWQYAPSADFWALVLWHQLISGPPGALASPRVLAASVPAAARATLRAYAFCQPGAPGSGAAAAVTLLLINLGGAQACVAMPAWAAAGAHATQFSLTPGETQPGATPIESPQTLLNGLLLQADAAGGIPDLQGDSFPVGAGVITLPPLSVSFVLVPLDKAGTGVPACVAPPS